MLLEITIAGQTWVFLLSILLGTAIGLSYDVFRILRVAFRHPAGVVFAEDLLFGILCTFCTFLFLLTTQYGEIRMFLLAGEAIGFALYYFTLGVLVLKAAKGIIRVIKWILRLLYKIFIAPIVFLGRKIFFGLAKLTAFFRGKLKNYAKKSNIYLQRCKRLLYNHSKHLRRKDGKKSEEVNLSQ